MREKAEREERLRGRTVMITGGSRGLGAALALAFVRAGAAVSVCARRPESLRELEAEVGAAGGRGVFHAVDVRDAGSVAAWVEETVHQLGPPAVLVNNASVLGPRVPLAEYPIDRWRETLEVNLTGTFVATRAVLPHMLRAGAGSVINVSSGAALPPRTGWGAYAVSKHALEGLSLNLAQELDGTGVRVNVVDPGAMRTGMRAAAYPAEDPASVKRPEDATGVFLWLASDAASGVSGQRFRADDWRGDRQPA